MAPSGDHNTTTHISKSNYEVANLVESTTRDTIRDELDNWIFDAFLDQIIIDVLDK